MSIVAKSTSLYSEVIASGKPLLYKHNSSTGFNIVCLNKAMNNSMNFNNNAKMNVIDIMNKIPKNFVVVLSVTGNLNSLLLSNEMNFLKSSFKTEIFDDITKIPSHWVMFFYKSSVNPTEYTIIKERHGNEDIVLDVTANEIADVALELVTLNETDLLKRKMAKMEEKFNSQIEELNRRIDGLVSKQSNEEVKE